LLCTTPSYTPQFDSRQARLAGGNNNLPLSSRDSSVTLVPAIGKVESDSYS